MEIINSPNVIEDMIYFSMTSEEPSAILLALHVLIELVSTKILDEQSLTRIHNFPITFINERQPIGLVLKSSIRLFARVEKRFPIPNSIESLMSHGSDEIMTEFVAEFPKRLGMVESNLQHHKALTSFIQEYLLSIIQYSIENLPRTLNLLISTLSFDFIARGIADAEDNSHLYFPLAWRNRLNLSELIETLWKFGSDSLEAIILLVSVKSTFFSTIQIHHTEYLDSILRGLLSFKWLEQDFHKISRLIHKIKISFPLPNILIHELGKEFLSSVMKLTIKLLNDEPLSNGLYYLLNFWRNCSLVSIAQSDSIKIIIQTNLIPIIENLWINMNKNLEFNPLEIEQLISNEIEKFSTMLRVMNDEFKTQICMLILEELSTQNPNPIVILITSSLLTIMTPNDLSKECQIALIRKSFNLLFSKPNEDSQLIALLSFQNSFIISFVNTSMQQSQYIYENLEDFYIDSNVTALIMLSMFNIDILAERFISFHLVNLTLDLLSGILRTYPTIQLIRPNLETLLRKITSSVDGGILEFLNYYSSNRKIIEKFFKIIGTMIFSEIHESKFYNHLELIIPIIILQPEFSLVGLLKNTIEPWQNEILNIWILIIFPNFKNSESEFPPSLEYLRLYNSFLKRFNIQNEIGYIIILQTFELLKTVTENSPSLIEGDWEEFHSYFILSFTILRTFLTSHILSMYIGVTKVFLKENQNNNFSNIVHLLLNNLPPLNIIFFYPKLETSFILLIETMSNVVPELLLFHENWLSINKILLFGLKNLNDNLNNICLCYQKLLRNLIEENNPNFLEILNFEFLNELFFILMDISLNILDIDVWSIAQPLLPLLITHPQLLDNYLQLNFLEKFISNHEKLNNISNNLLSTISNNLDISNYTKFHDNLNLFINSINKL